jgi:hypothetical protein
MFITLPKKAEFINEKRSAKICFFITRLLRDAQLRSPRTTSLDTTRPTAPQLNISQKALGTLPEEGDVIPKHVGANIYN